MSRAAAGFKLGGGVPSPASLPPTLPLVADLLDAYRGFHADHLKARAALSDSQRELRAYSRAAEVAEARVAGEAEPKDRTDSLKKAVERAQAEASAASAAAKLSWENLSQAVAQQLDAVEAELDAAEAEAVADLLATLDRAEAIGETVSELRGQRASARGVAEGDVPAYQPRGVFGTSLDKCRQALQPPPKTHFIRADQLARFHRGESAVTVEGEPVVEGMRWRVAHGAPRLSAREHALIREETG